MKGWRLFSPAALALVAISVLPALALMGAGFLWLRERQLLLAWMALAGVVAALSWIVVRVIRRPSPAPAPLLVPAKAQWSTSGLEAWETVERIAARVRNDARSDDAVLEMAALWDLSRELVEAVATQLHPEAKEPLLEVRLPDALLAAEHLAADLREAVSESVPGSHMLTVGDVLRGRRFLERSTSLYRLYRVIAVGVDPISSAVRELRGVAAGGLMHASLAEIRGWLLDAYAKKIGYHAIELYGRELVADAEALHRHRTSASARVLENDAAIAARLREEPLRVLVVGQVNAGKSSLINALFGEQRAAVDVIPRTDGIEAYVLERDDVERAIVLDTAGHAGRDGRDPLAAAAAEICRTDLVIVVCSATSAARGPDRELVERLRAIFERKTGEPTVMLVALTHIDRLRPFREWDPPYDVAKPRDPKAVHIRKAMEAVARDLDVDLACVVPMGLAPQRMYNVDEALVPAILDNLDGARRLRYLRCRRDVRAGERWPRLLAQAREAGRLIASEGPGWIAQATRGDSAETGGG